jgi:hypothetical protein
MLKIKYRLISAAMVIAPLLSAGIATTVNASPISKSKPAIYQKETPKKVVSKKTTPKKVAPKPVQHVVKTR